MTLYNSMYGENWFDNTSRLSGDPCVNSWFGVSCNGSLTSINRLVLFNNELSGTIPVELVNLTNLIKGTFFGNQLTGTILDSLGTITTSFSNQTTSLLTTNIINIISLPAW